jgi:hypothetical protein
MGKFPVDAPLERVLRAFTWLSTERERAAVENRAEKALGNHLPDPVEEIALI